MPTGAKTSSGPLICGYFFLSAASTRSPAGVLLAEEAVGLDEMRIAAVGPGEFGEASARDPPVRHDRHAPTHALARFHQLRAGRRVADEDDGVGAGVLEPRELRHHVDVGVLELLDADDLERGIALVGFDQARSRSMRPRDC